MNRHHMNNEYHIIYPDATAIRKVVYNNSTTEAPGFQDVQYFTNPGETALDVVELNAVTVANVNGGVDELIWKKPNKNPQTDLENATIQYINTKSDWKVYALYPEGGIGTWGSFEQSKYTDDPFAGPWNHWPISLLPSDGRFAVAHDRVTHFALGAGNAGKEAVVHYGFTTEPVTTLIPRAKSWQSPPAVNVVKGGSFIEYSRAEKAFLFDYEGKSALSCRINASSVSPLVNPAFVINNCSSDHLQIILNGKRVKSGKSCRIGQSYDTAGIPRTIIWLDLKSDKPVSITFK